MLIPGLTIVSKPFETYLIVREPDGDRELTPDECRKLYNVAEDAEAPAREAIALWMMSRGYATGHGDTIGDLLSELEAQAKEWSKALPHGD